MPDTYVNEETGDSVTFYRDGNVVRAEVVSFSTGVPITVTFILPPTGIATALARLIEALYVASDGYKDAAAYYEAEHPRD